MTAPLEADCVFKLKTRNLKMTKRYALSAAKRDEAGKGVARALRRENKVPAVIYGGEEAPVTISLQEKEASKEYFKGHMFTTLCNMDVEGKEHLVLARDIQIHPVKDRVMHVDFLRVTPKTKLTVSVPVNLQNYEESPAAQAKGVLNVVRHTVDIVCLATNIPEAIDVDMSKVEVGDTVKISDAAMPEGAKPAIDDRDFTLVTIAAPKRLATTEEEAAEAAEGEEGASDAAEGDAEQAEDNA
jgi:large subunit ribosomal protein L25